MEMHDLLNIQKNMHEIFLEQDYESEYFDIIFYVDGKELHVHSSMLVNDSPVFKKLFFKNRSKGNGPIRIDDYTYDEFKEFIRLFYLAYNDDDAFDVVEINKKHIFAAIELAEIYEADRIKELCDSNFISFLDQYIEDVFEYISFAYKHSLKCKSFNVIYVNALIEYDDFENLDKSAVKAFVYYAIVYEKYEKEVCEVIYKWAEHQAMINEEMYEVEKNEAILHQIKDILPYFSLQCLLEFYVNEKRLISISDANEYKTIEVTIEFNGKILFGSFVDGYGIYDITESKNNYQLTCHGDRKACFRNKKFKHPSSPSTVQKMKGCEWYLLFEDDVLHKRIHGVGECCILTLEHCSLIKNTDYLIAEMKPNENEFIIESRTSATVSRKK